MENTRDVGVLSVAMSLLILSMDPALERVPHPSTHVILYPPSLSCRSGILLPLTYLSSYSTVASRDAYVLLFTFVPFYNSVSTSRLNVIQ